MQELMSRTARSFAERLLDNLIGKNLGMTVSFLKLSARQTPGESLMNVCRCRYECGRACALMLVLEMSPDVSREGFVKSLA